MNTQERNYYRMLNTAKDILCARKFTKNVYRMHRAIVGEIPLFEALKQARIKLSSNTAIQIWSAYTEYHCELN